MKTRAAARVTLSIEFPIDSTWGGDCKMDQVVKQARDSCTHIVTKLIRRMDNPSKDFNDLTAIKIRVVSVDDKIILTADED